MIWAMALAACFIMLCAVSFQGCEVEAEKFNNCVKETKEVLACKARLG